MSKQDLRDFNDWYKTQEGLYQFEKIKLEYVWLQATKRKNSKIEKLEGMICYDSSLKLIKEAREIIYTLSGDPSKYSKEFEETVAKWVDKTKDVG